MSAETRYVLYVQYFSRVQKSKAVWQATSIQQLLLVLPSEVGVIMSDEEDANPPGAEIDQGDEGDRKPAASSPAAAAAKQAATEKENTDSTSSDNDQGTKRAAAGRENSDSTRGEDDPGSVKGKRKRRKVSSSDGIDESANSLDRASAAGSTAISLQEKWDEMFTRLVHFKVCYALTDALK
jgi:hypothetical protein